MQKQLRGAILGGDLFGINNMNKYKFYANLVLVIHTLFLALILASLPIIIFYPQLRYIPAVFGVITILQWWVMRDRCYLASLENKFRAKYDKRHTYERGCIVHYLFEWFGIKTTNFVVDAFLYAYFAVIIYFAIFPLHA
jgi:hypothetical protein